MEMTQPGALMLAEVNVRIPHLAHDHLRDREHRKG